LALSVNIGLTGRDLFSIFGLGITERDDCFRY
jgi:hypothetical protein